MTAPLPAPHFDGFRFEIRCKLCKVMLADLEFAAELHGKIINEGLSHASVMAWANKRLEVLNAKPPPPDDRAAEFYPLPPFNKANFSVHFNNHISDRAMFMRAMRSALRKRRERDLADVPASVQIASGSALREDNGIIGVYQDMLEDISYLRGLLTEFKREHEKKKRAMSPVDLSKIQSTMTTISTLTSGLMKFMTTGGLAKMAVQYALEAQGLAWIESFNKSAEVISHKVTEEDLDLFRRSIADRMKVAIKDVHQELARRFGLK